MVAIIDHGEQRAAEKRGPPVWRRLLGALGALMPKGLYARALIIIIAPIVLLQSVLAFVFMERHWQAVTRRLSEATARDVGALTELFENYSRDDNYRDLVRMARERFNLSIQVLPPGDLPVARPKPFFSLLDRTLSREISKQIRRPFWIDTVGRSRHVEIRVKFEKAVLRILARRSQTYASNSHIFLVWMVVTSLILLTVAILFLRNQIRPILRLAKAAEAFGKGRPAPEDFRPRGAREVRQAAHAFLEMRDRIESHMAQRATLLAGVSHDLRTILTRFELQLAMLGDAPEIEALQSDAREMQLMLEDYMGFAKGHGAEDASPVDVPALLEEIRCEAAHAGKTIEIRLRRKRKSMVVPLRRHAFKRAIGNLVNNATRFADRILVSATLDRKWLRIVVEDDGPGIPEAEREKVFQPFYRIDDARNQDQGNTGLGLAIARDITHGHGGEIWLEGSSLGGLKAVVMIPV